MNVADVASTHMPLEEPSIAHERPIADDVYTTAAHESGAPKLSLGPRRAWGPAIDLNGAYSRIYLPPRRWCFRGGGVGAGTQWPRPNLGEGGVGARTQWPRPFGKRRIGAWTQRPRPFGKRRIGAW